MSSVRPHSPLAGAISHPVVAGLISVIVNYGGTFILVFQAAKAAGLSPELTAWVWSVSIGVGVTGLILSWAAREPIITAWSTPAAAFLVTALATTPYAEAVGAYLASAAAFVLLGLSGWFERVIRLIPPGVAAGLLAGILLQFGIQAFGGVSVDPALAGLLIAAYVILKRVTARYAVVGILALGLAFLLLQQRVDLSGLELRLAAPVFTRPEFSLNAMLSGAAAVPDHADRPVHARHAGAAQRRLQDQRQSHRDHYRAGLAADGAVRLARLQHRRHHGRHLHRPRVARGSVQRWIAGIAAGVFYILVGVFGVTLAAVFMAFPATFITTLAGLALLGTIGGSLAGALADPKTREASLITFLAAAANIKLFGIGGAFWGLCIGLLAHLALNGRWPGRKARAEAGAACLRPRIPRLPPPNPRRAVERPPIDRRRAAGARRLKTGVSRHAASRHAPDACLCPSTRHLRARQRRAPGTSRWNTWMPSPAWR